MTGIEFFWLAVRFAGLCRQLMKLAEKYGVPITEIEEEAQVIINNIDDAKKRAEFDKLFEDEHDHMGS